MTPAAEAIFAALPPAAEARRVSRHFQDARLEQQAAEIIGRITDAAAVGQVRVTWEGTLYPAAREALLAAGYVISPARDLGQGVSGVEITW